MPLLAALALAGAVSGASCDGNTRELEACLSARLATHEATLAKYVSAARKRIRPVAASTAAGASMADQAPGAFDAAERA